MSASPVSLRHNRAFRALLAGSSVSMVGSRLTTIAYPMLVLWLTQSPVYAGIAVFAATAPSILFYIPVGALVDRWDPRRTMLAAEAGRGAAVTFIVVVVLVHWANIPLIIGLAVTEEILEVFAALAERRYFQALAEPSSVGSISARTETRDHLSMLAGRPLGGLLFEVSPILPFLVDMLSFVFSVGTLCVFKGGAPIKRSLSERPSITKDIKSGLQWLAKDRFTRIAIPLASSMTFICQALIMVFMSDAQKGDLPSAEIGVVLAAAGLGGALGAALGSRLRVFAARSRITLQMPIWCLALFVLAEATQFVKGVYVADCMMGAMFLLAFSGAVSNIELDTYVRQQVPDMVARVTSIGRLMSYTALAAGPVVGGFLIERWGIHVAVTVLFAMTLLLTVVAWCVPDIRFAPVPAASEDHDVDWTALCMQVDIGKGELARVEQTRTGTPRYPVVVMLKFTSRVSRPIASTQKAYSEWGIRVELLDAPYPARVDTSEKSLSGTGADKYPTSAVISEAERTPTTAEVTAGCRSVNCSAAAATGTP